MKELKKVKALVLKEPEQKKATILRCSQGQGKDRKVIVTKAVFVLDYNIEGNC